MKKLERIALIAAKERWRANESLRAPGIDAAEVIKRFSHHYMAECEEDMALKRLEEGQATSRAAATAGICSGKR